MIELTETVYRKILADLFYPLPGKVDDWIKEIPVSGGVLRFEWLPINKMWLLRNASELTIIPERMQKLYKIT